MLDPIELVQYTDARGRVPFEQWLQSLDPGVRVRVLSATVRLGAGNLSSTKSVGQGVLELRMDFGPGYRVYFGRDGAALILLLGGGTKRRQQKDIAAAQTLWSEYKDSKERAD